VIRSHQSHLQQDGYTANPIALELESILHKNMPQGDYKQSFRFVEGRLTVRERNLRKHLANAERRVRSHVRDSGARLREDRQDERAQMSARRGAATSTIRQREMFWSSFPGLVPPLPVANLRHIIAVLSDVVLVLDQPVAHLLFHVCADRLKLRHALDHIHHEVKTVEVV
jgi:hypothetical protein